MTLRVELRDIGCFEEAVLELRPLTLLVGVNSVGKSLLLYLLWVLASTPPEFEVLGKRIGESGIMLARRVLDSVERGRELSEDVHRLISMHVEALPEALSVSLQRSFASAVFEPRSHDWLGSEPIAAWSGSEARG